MATQFTPPQWTDAPQWIYGVPRPSTPTELSPTTIPDVEPGAEHANAESVPPEASPRPSKKGKDMLRKRDQRADDKQHFAEICELLEIPSTPKRTLAHRSECPCIHLFMTLKESCVSQS